MKKILNFGSLNLDYVYSVENFAKVGETIASDNMVINCGGKGLNQSIAAAKAGATVYHAGKIGTNGDILQKELNKFGVNTDYLLKSKSPNGHAIIQVDKHGQNNILLFSGSNSEISKEEIDNCIDDFNCEDYLILQNEINNIPYIMEKANKKGMKIVFNPSPITNELFNYPLSYVSLIVLNEIEGAALSGKTEPDEILVQLKKQFPDTEVLLTLGKNGAVYFDGTNKIFHGIYRTNVVDTTAAGDTMLGYFVASLAFGIEPKRALERASKASAIAISRNGAASSIPSHDEVENCNFEMICY